MSKEPNKDCHAHLTFSRQEPHERAYAGYECTGKENCPIKNLLQGQAAKGFKLHYIGNPNHTEDVILQQDYNQVVVDGSPLFRDYQTRNEGYCQHGFTYIERISMSDFDSRWQDKGNLISRIPGLLSRVLNLKI